MISKLGVGTAEFAIYLYRLSPLSFCFREIIQILNRTLQTPPTKERERLNRIDKIKQAISWIKAEQSKHFLCHELDDFDGHTYSEEDISERIVTLARGETRWLHFFNKYNIVPYYLTYESLCEDKAKAIEGVLDFLNFEFLSDDTLAEFISRIKLSVQQYDATNVEWYRQYMT